MITIETDITRNIEHPHSNHLIDNKKYYQEKSILFFISVLNYELLWTPVKIEKEST